MNRPLGVVKGVEEPESLMKLPPAATTMALPVALLVMPAPVFSVRSPVALARNLPLDVSVPSMVMPALLPLVVAAMVAAVMEGSVRLLVEVRVTLFNAVPPPIAPPRLMVAAVASRL